MIIKPGTKIKERYIVLRELGEGGFASVYQAEDLQLNRLVAIKILKISYVGQSEDLQRFQREAKILAQLQHPNIVAVFSFDILEEHYPCIIMEYLKGQSLAAYLADHGKLTSDLAYDLMSQVALGLAFAHSMGLAHRDLTPNNIFVNRTEQGLSTKIIDFGLSKLVSDTGKLTSTGVILGTPKYMSPETARGQQPDASSDVYSFGCVMYEALTGKAAFQSDTPIGFLHLQQHSYPPEPFFSWQDSDKERRLKQILLRCLQKVPEARYQSASELVAALAGDVNLNEIGSVSSRQMAIHPWADQKRGGFKKGYLIACCSAVLLVALLFLLQEPLTALLAEGLIHSRSSMFEKEELVFANTLKKKVAVSSCRKSL